MKQETEHWIDRITGSIMETQTEGEKDDHRIIWLSEGSEVDLVIYDRSGIKNAFKDFFKTANWMKLVPDWSLSVSL